MINITILTPTYNRCDSLIKLYESLRHQTDKSFIWLIIDDGSSDNTKSTVQDWIDEKRIKIEYYKKSNGGKHTALNYSYAFIKTPLTFIVDSDDYLTKNAIEIINEKYSLYGNESDLCGFSFLRKSAKGGYLSPKAPSDNLKSSYCECRVNKNLVGDMAEVWFTPCLKEYPFPELKNEKFLGEDTVWIKMSEKYKLRFYNTAIYISDYLDDGLTNNRRRHNIKSPLGCVERAKAFLNADTSLKWKIKAMLQYRIYSNFAGLSNKTQMKEAPNKVLFIILMLPAQLLYSKWKRDYECNS